MKTCRIRTIAYVAFGTINLVGFICLVGESRYHIPATEPQYESAPCFPQDLSSWFSGRP
jgi:hypothetical protein